MEGGMIWIGVMLVLFTIALLLLGLALFTRRKRM
jgi:hypothetical protein